jgi:hypothetical protein
MALKTLLRAKAESRSGLAPDGSEALIQKLRVLGITEDVL